MKKIGERAMDGRSNDPSYCKDIIFFQRYSLSRHGCDNGIPLDKVSLFAAISSYPLILFVVKHYLCLYLLYNVREAILLIASDCLLSTVRYKYEISVQSETIDFFVPPHTHALTHTHTKRTHCCCDFKTGDLLFKMLYSSDIISMFK